MYTIAIYGAGQFGEYVYEKIKESAKIEVECFIDKKCGGVKYGVPIISLESFCEKKVLTDYIVIASKEQGVINQMVALLLKKEVERGKLYICPASIWEGKLEVLNCEGELSPLIKNISRIKPVLEYVEYHASDSCNLKCKGCGHISNLTTCTAFPDIKDFENSLEQIKRKFQNIVIFRLLGGEPLLNKDLYQYIYAVRERFPYCDIRVVTNGLLFPLMSEELIGALRKCGVTVQISQYPPTRKMIDEIIEFAYQNDIKFTISTPITEFFKMRLDEGNISDPVRAWSKCISNSCHFLRDGRLYPCGKVFFDFEWQDFFDKPMSVKLRDAYSADIINGEEDGWAILSKLCAPFEYCMYCPETVETYKWEISGRNVSKEDWTVSKGIV